MAKLTVQFRHPIGQRVQIHDHNINVSGENLHLELATLQRNVILGHCVTHRRLVFKADVSKIIGTNLQEHDLPAVLKVFKQSFLVYFLMDVPHDDGQIGLKVLRRVGRHHKEALSAKVLLVPGQQQRNIVLTCHPNKRRDGPLRTLLFLQEVNLQHRGRLLQVGHQLVLFSRRRNVLHVDQLLSVHCATAARPAIKRQQKI